MSQVPFPHILNAPKNTDGGLFRVVQPDELNVGDTVYVPFQRKQNNISGQMEMQYDQYIITEKSESRKAKGNWQNWPCHPFYFEGIAKYNGLIFESDKAPIL